jgi:hypothetical protein
MTHRMITVLMVLAVLILVSARGAAACERCKNSGFVCNGHDDCSEVVTCQDVLFGNGGGSNDCWVDSYSVCHLDGGLCMWASITMPEEGNPTWALTCHESKS